MIERLAVLAIDKADGSLELVSGEKGEIYQKTRAMIRELNATEGHDVLRLRAFYQGGLLKGYKFKSNIRAASEVVIEDEVDESDDLAKDIRSQLKAKGVKVPPRIGGARLLELATEHGIMV